MPDRTTKTSRGGFTFRVRLGEYEVEIDGTREEVLKTIEDLPCLMTKIHKAFEDVKPKKVTTLTVKTEAAKDVGHVSQKYPRIQYIGDTDDAVISLLETDWGKWRPRTIDEIREALKTNGMDYSGHALTGVLTGLVKKELVKKWNTDAGFVYILAEKETLNVREEID